MLSSDATSVDMEITPESEISLASDSVRVDEDAGVVTLTLLRNVNMQLRCSVTLETIAEDYNTAVAGVHFVGNTSIVNFAPEQATADVEIQILREAGYSSEDKSFTVRLTNPENASLSDSRLTVHINNVDAPPPAPPVLSSNVSSSSSLSIEWTDPFWPNSSTFSPSQEMLVVLQWAVEMAQVESKSEEVTTWVDVSDQLDGEMSKSVTLIDLDVHAMYKFRVRVRTQKGWSEFSDLSDGIRTLAVRSRCLFVWYCLAYTPYLPRVLD